MREPTSNKNVEVEFTEQQLELIDRIAEEWRMSREEAVARAIQEFLSDSHRALMQV